MKKKLKNGFTLVELIVGALLITIITTAILLGVIYVKKSLHKMRLKDSAFERLTGYTEYWRGRIAADNFQQHTQECETYLSIPENNVLKDLYCLHFDNSEPENNFEGRECVVSAEICHNINEINTNSFGFIAFRLKTEITWDDGFNNSSNIMFYVSQPIWKNLKRN